MQRDMIALDRDETEEAAIAVENGWHPMPGIKLGGFFVFK
jgi:hypothetical protein